MKKRMIQEDPNASKVALTDKEFAKPATNLNRCRVYGHRGFSR